VEKYRITVNNFSKNKNIWGYPKEEFIFKQTILKSKILMWRCQQTCFLGAKSNTMVKVNKKYYMTRVKKTSTVCMPYNFPLLQISLAEKLNILDDKLSK
jgi:hypothetical protein